MRQYIRPEIVSWCFVKLERTNCDNEEIIEEITSKYINDELPNEYLSYANTNDGPSGTLSAEALLYDISVKVRRGEPNNLKLEATINSNSSGDYVNLYHNGNYLNHFDLLVEENDIEKLKRAEIKNKYGR